MNRKYYVFILIILISFFTYFNWVEIKTLLFNNKFITQIKQKEESKVELNELVLPKEGVLIPVKLANLGKKMIDLGVIDKDKLDALYEKRGTREEMDALINGQDSVLVVKKENANNILNFFWALGLGNKNEILEKGPLSLEGKTANFASTGGWSLSKGSAMDHYSKHELLKLAPSKQKMVEEVSKNIFRPCCNNSTYFPDCNHGMAMLGFIELAASQNLTKKEIYKYALALNSFWFPNDYLTIAQYLKENGKDWIKVDPKEVLGKSYSSQQGSSLVKQKVKNPPFVKGVGACGV